MSTIKANTIDSLNGVDEVSIPTLDKRMAKAWVNFNGAGAVTIRDSYNIAGITDNGVGQYSITFENQVPIGARVASCNGANFPDVGLGSTTVVSINTYTFAGALADVGVISFQAFSN